MDKNKKALIYYRVSTEDQARNGISLEQQKVDCLAYAYKNDYEVVRKFHDDGISAKTLDRKGLQDMLKFCSSKKNEVDAVIIYKVDRLSRDTGDYTDILKELKSYSVELISITESINNTPSGKFMGNIMSATAQYDNDVRSERISDAMKQIIKNGKWCYEAPLGYLNFTSESGGKYIKVDEERAEHIKWIFEEFAKGTHTLKEIRVMVNTRGLRSKQGNPVSFQFMSKMIRNTFYYGMMYLARYDEYYPGTHQPLISEETFRVCQALLKNNGASDKASYRGKKSTSLDFPLRGFLCCKECNRPITGSYSTGRNGQKYPYYKCYSHKCTAFRSGTKSRVEDAFVKRLKEITPNPELVKSYKAIILDVSRSKQKDSHKEQMRLAKTKEDISQRKNGLFDLKSRNLLDDADFEEQLNRIKQEEAQAVMLYNEFSVEELDMERVVNDVFDIIENLSTFWEESTYERKLRLQGSIFLEKPTFDGERVENSSLSILALEKGSLELPYSTLVARRRIELLLPG